MRWISVKEWLPQEGIRVLVYARGGIWICYLEKVLCQINDDGDKIDIWKDVVSEETIFPSHWTLLPELPRFEE